MEIATERRTPRDLLKNRIRSGLVSTDRVQLAATLGHEVARSLFPKADQVDVYWPGWSIRSDCIRRVDKKDGVLFAVLCAERCLWKFERDHPSDTRPRSAIKEARRWLNGDGRSDPVLSNSAYAAFYAKDRPSARAAAYAAYAADSVCQSWITYVNSASNESLAERPDGASQNDEYRWHRLTLARIALGEIS